MRLHTKVVQACKFLMIVYTVFKNLMSPVLTSHQPASQPAQVSPYSISLLQQQLDQQQCWERVPAAVMDIIQCALPTHLG